MSQSGAQENDDFFHSFGNIRMLDALEILQNSLNRIKANNLLEGSGATLESADISLETVTETSINGEVTILVVTVAGAAARNSTHTVSMTLEPAVPIRGLDRQDTAVVVESLVSLTRELGKTAKAARQGTATQLTLSKGSIKVDLIISANGSIEVSAPGIWKTILEKIGFDAKASAATEFISTSSITLNFAESSSADSGE